MPDEIRHATPIDARGYAHPDVLVSTDWVNAHLKDPDVRIIECDEDVLLYETGHIEGAVKIDWVTDLNDPVTRDYVYPERFQELLQSLGPINDTSSVPWTMFNDNVSMGYFDVYDQYLLNLLYDPRIKAGMTVQEVKAVLPDVLTDVREWVRKVNNLPE